MDTIIREEPGSPPQRLDLQETLFRAALLARHGREARSLAARLTSIVEVSSGRSCVEAGMPIQLSIDAPGDIELRAGVRLGAKLDAAVLGRILTREEAERFCATFKRLQAPTHANLGFWLFWSQRRKAIFADLRDPEPTSAIQRLLPMLSSVEARQFHTIREYVTGARPWAISVELGHAQRVLHLYWLLNTGTIPEAILERLLPGAWAKVVDILGYLTTHPGRSGRWMFTTPLTEDSDGGRFAVGNSGWAVVPEDDRKQRGLGMLVSALGGPREYAEALWSFCRGAAEPKWRVGRTCEIWLGGSSPRARIFLTPQAQIPATAGMTSSDSVVSAGSLMDGDPVREYRITR